MAIPFGWGDSDGIGTAAYGEHVAGWGHDLPVVQLFVVGGAQVEDLGGAALNFDVGADNVFPTGLPLQVKIGGIVCYSGVQEQGAAVYCDAAGRRFSCCTPHLFGQTGPVDVQVTGGGFDSTFAGVVEVVRHVGRTGVTHLGMRHPRDVYAQDLYRARGQ